MESQGDVELGLGAEPQKELKQPKGNNDGKTGNMVAVVGMGRSIDEVQEVSSFAECAVLRGCRADDHETPHIGMDGGEVDDTTSAVAALDLGALETRAAADAEEGDECPVCLETLVLNDPIRLPCKHLICNQCLQQYFSSCIGMV